MAQASNDLQRSLVAGRPYAHRSTTRNLTSNQISRFDNVGSLRTYLLTKGYTNARLNTMTKNDMVNAARLAGGFTEA